MRWSSLCLSTVVVVGCSKPTPPSNDAGAAVPSASATTQSSAQAEVPERDAAAPKRPTNLLQIVPAKVAVSSVVDNPSDFPEHLMDGDLSTAWNGKTRDLKGAWIAFRVPKDAHVDHVLMTAGFVKKNAKDDLFTQNHRVKKVTLYRDKKKVRDVDLDIESRDLQKIPVDADGGEFKIEIAETASGTKKEWMEVVISEMIVVGTPGKERRPPAEPLRITLYDLDGKLTKLPPIRYASGKAQKGIAEACAAWLAPQIENWTEAEARAGRAKPACKVVPTRLSFRGDATYKSIHEIATPQGYSTDARHLVVELQRGFVITSIAYGFENEAGCPSVWTPGSIGEVRIENGHLLALVDGYCERSLYTGAENSFLRGAVWCKDDGTDFVCKEHSPQMAVALGVKPVKPNVPGDAVPWSFLSKFHITNDSELVIDDPPPPQ